MTLARVYGIYQEKYDDLDDEKKRDTAVMEYSTFNQHSRHIFRTVKLTRNKQYSFGSCVSLNLILQDLNVGKEEKSAAQDELSMYNAAARDQRRVPSTFTNRYEATICTWSNLPRDFLADHIDDPSYDADLEIGAVQILCEYFEQGVALPHYV